MRKTVSAEKCRKMRKVSNDGEVECKGVEVRKKVRKKVWKKVQKKERKSSVL